MQGRSACSLLLYPWGKMSRDTVLDGECRFCKQGDVAALRGSTCRHLAAPSQPQSPAPIAKVGSHRQGGFPPQGLGKTPVAAPCNAGRRTDPLTNLQSGFPRVLRLAELLHRFPEAAASGTAPAAPKQLPSSPAPRPISPRLLLLGAFGVTRTICCGSERPPGSAGF